MRGALATVAMMLISCSCGRSKDPPPPPSHGRPAAVVPQAAECTSDADCVVACDVPGECCPGRWCETVQPRDVAAAAAAHNQTACRDPERARCPEPPARPDPSYSITPRCRAGTCVAVKEPLQPASAAGTPSGPETVDTSGLDRRCKTAADCRIVDELPCNHCNCGSVAISVAAVEAFQRASAAIQCGPAPQVMCGSCLGYTATCDGGTCRAAPL